MLTHNEKVDLLLIFGEAQRNSRAALRLYMERYPNRHIPDHKIFVRLEQNLRQNEDAFSIRKRKLITKRVCDDATVAAVCQHFDQNPRQSLRRAGMQINVSKTSLQRCLKRTGYHPYKFKNLQNLGLQHINQRQQFLAQIAVLETEDRRLYSHILWTDESRFVSNGLPNRQNERFWATENPHQFNIIENQGHFGINVWCGIIGRHLVGPFFYDGVLNSERFLQFLEEEVPNLIEDIPLQLRRNMWWQMDGAPPHNAQIIRNFLNENFPNKWIGRNGPVVWPAKSPDLTPLDFFLWGRLKSIVYKSPSRTLQHLKDKIRAACRQVTPQELLNVTGREVRKRLQMCVAEDGAHIEQLL